MVDASPPIQKASPPTRLPYLRKAFYHYFRLWRIDDTWARPHEALAGGRGCAPGEINNQRVIVDSQSVETTGVGSGERGYDAGKKAKERKLHLLVDSQGLVLRTRVHAANAFDLKKA